MSADVILFGKRNQAVHHHSIFLRRFPTQDSLPYHTPIPSRVEKGCWNTKKKKQKPKRV